MAGECEEIETENVHQLPTRYKTFDARGIQETDFPVMGHAFASPAIPLPPFSQPLRILAEEGRRG